MEIENEGRFTCRSTNNAIFAPLRPRRAGSVFKRCARMMIIATVALLPENACENTPALTGRLSVQGVHAFPDAKRLLAVR